MFKIWKLRLKNELEQLKSLHQIELNKKDADMELRRRTLEKDHELKLKETVSLLKLDSDQRVKQLEIDNLRKVNELTAKFESERTSFKEKFLNENYEKMTNAMTKLHEEGDKNSKFTQELALKMLDQMPEHKSKKTRVLISGKRKDDLEA